MATLADSFLDDLDELGESSDDEQQQEGASGEQAAETGGDGDDDMGVGVRLCVSIR